MSKKPPLPFITSTIQIECNRRFRISTKKIMMILQKLYENGYITYHRTDSTNICKEFTLLSQEYIIKKYGEKYLNKSNSEKKSKVKGAQEAHEAIRPTKVNRLNLPDQFSNFEKKIYNIIWKRTIASFMSNMIYNKFIMKISIQKRKEIFIATSKITIFDGFTILYKDFKTKDILKLV
jgi:DNA topoisomerase-1